MATVLETENVTREFGALVAVDNVSMSIDDAEITSIIGPNGAGKTTFYNVLAGQLEPTQGRVRLRPRKGYVSDTDDGSARENGLVDVTGMEPFEINRMGLARAFQINNVFERLTVRENVRVARISCDNRINDIRSIAADDAELEEETIRVLELTNLQDLADEVCSNLSHGDLRKVEIALALGTDPSVVLLDEPTAGMNVEETHRMVDLIGELNDSTETTFVVTEHDMEVVLGVSDRILVFDNGQLIADGTTDEIMADDRVREAYLGGEG